MKKKHWNHKVALVTGASSGIGEATARRLAMAGMKVVLVARRLNRLMQLRAEIESDGGRALVAEADLSSPYERQRVSENVPTVDVLINNAGFGWYGYFSDMPWSTIQEMLRVNIEATTHLTSLFLPKMIGRNDGHIINVGSISGSLPSQGIALYSATKAFLDAFSTALYRETRGTNVCVSVVRAGPVRTEFGKIALQKEKGKHVPTEKVGTSASHIARHIWKLTAHPKRLTYVPRWMSIVPWVELSFGWLEDLLGPLLLKRTK